MGGIWMANKSFVDSFVEIVGFKAGLVLQRDKLLTLIAEASPDIAARLADPYGGTRIGSDEYEEVVAFLLYRVGNLETPRIGSPASDVYHRFKGDPEAETLIDPVSELFIAFMESGQQDGGAFVADAYARFGAKGADIALEYLKGTMRYLQRSPWQKIRHVDWKDERELTDLFASERLESMHGKFFDQRFIDYIARNFEEIDDVHWRQFEGATAEFFERQGFTVDIGPGRNDDGIDLRVYPKEVTDDMPPLIIVQCKRERRKIGKTLLKSVYADVLHEKAESGLIVTTTDWSPGTKTMQQARGYPVEAINRAKLRDWIGAMKSEPL